MIPKVIHYCWFGRNPLPELAVKCIESWRKYLPDYKIIEWNEDNFDVNCTVYTKEAYMARKYAFVSDYARFWILYNYGGLYFDTDVEIISCIDDIISHGSFMGCESEVMPETKKMAVAPGLGLGAEPGLEFYKKMLDMYHDQRFFNQNGSYNQKTVVAYTTEMLNKYGLLCTDRIQKCAEIWIYPKDFFCPLDYTTKQLTVTENTRSIHHYSASWITRSQRIYKIIENCIGEKYAKVISRFLKDIRLFK